ncbi:MAG: hypothetical protein ABI256_06530 [Rhodoferax sp.]
MNENKLHAADFRLRCNCTADFEAFRVKAGQQVHFAEYDARR